MANRRASGSSRCSPGRGKLLLSLALAFEFLLLGSQISRAADSIPSAPSVAQTSDDVAKRDREAAIKAATEMAIKVHAEKEAERAARPRSKPDIMVGVLDQQRCPTSTGEGAEPPTAARLLFAKIMNKWVALNQRYEDPIYPEMEGLDLHDAHWTIAFDGRSLGEIQLTDPQSPNPQSKEWYFGRDNQYLPLDPKAVPIVRNVNGEFSGWCFSPKRRPLVLVSKANFKDPDGWKPFAPSEEVKRRLYVPVKVHVGRLNAKRWPKDQEEGIPFDIKVTDLVFQTSFRSTTGRQLISIVSVSPRPSSRHEL